MGLDIASATVFVDKETKLDCHVRDNFISGGLSLQIYENNFRSHNLTIHFSSLSQLEDFLSQIKTSLNKLKEELHV